jgi:AraC-like DNA-binding protein
MEVIRGWERNCRQEIRRAVERRGARAACRVHQRRQAIRAIAARARKREDLLKATERDLAKISKAVARKTRPLRGAAAIGLAVGAVLDKHKMAKHFELTISDASFTCARKTEQIAEEAALDGLYAVRTSLPKETIDDAAAVRAYKSLSRVERAFRSLKTVDLHVRPIYPLAGASRSRSCVPVHARLLRRMAYARPSCADAPRRR